MLGQIDPMLVVGPGRFSISLDTVQPFGVSGGQAVRLIPAGAGRAAACLEKFEMEYFLFWVAFSIAVGMFAGTRRNRSGFGWFILAMIISPLLAGIFVAILKERSAQNIKLASSGGRSLFVPTVVVLASMIIVLVGIIAARVDPASNHAANASVTRPTP